MRAADLIDLLKKIPPDCHIIVHDYRGDWKELTLVFPFKGTRGDSCWEINSSPTSADFENAKEVMLVPLRGGNPEKNCTRVIIK